MLKETSKTHKYCMCLLMGNLDLKVCMWGVGNGNKAKKKV